MTEDLLADLAILVLAGFVGFAVISKVPNTLHTPLMSGTNAIHGIVLLGGIVVLGRLENPSVLDSVILVVAIVFGMINVVGGFLVTDRMLAMFKPKKAPEAEGAGASQRAPASEERTKPGSRPSDTEAEGAGASRRGEREQTSPGRRPFSAEHEAERR